jgi:hypothetical protein
MDKKQCENDEIRHEQELKKCEQDNEQLKSQIKQLRERNAALERKLQPGGADYPPCLKNATGHADYIFDITLTSKGILIHRSNFPAHTAESLTLPVASVPYDREISDDAFLTDTDPLFNYSEQHDCRFYVRLCDQTLPAEKDIYKQRLRTVEEHFYKLQVLCGSQAAPP